MEMAAWFVGTIKTIKGIFMSRTVRIFLDVLGVIGVISGTLGIVLLLLRILGVI